MDDLFLVTHSRLLYPVGFKSLLSQLVQSVCVCACGCVAAGGGRQEAEGVCGQLESQQTTAATSGTNTAAY